MPMPVSVTLSGGHFVEETYEHLWIIPKWTEVSQTQHRLKKHAWTFQTAGTASRIETTWKVEWKLLPVLPGSATKSCQVQWTLIDMRGMDGESLIAKIKTSVIKKNRDGSSDLDYQNDEQERYFQLNEPVQTSFFWISEDVIKPGGNLSVQLNLTLVLPRRLHIEPERDSETESGNEEVPKKVHNAENVQQDEVKKEKQLKAEAIRWYDDWHDRDEEVGSGRPHDNDNTSNVAHSSGAGAGTRNQAKVPSSSNRGKGPGNDNGRKRKRRRKKHSKRMDKNDLVVNQEGLKKIKLESNYCPRVKKEVDQEDESRQQGNGSYNGDLKSPKSSGSSKKKIIKQEVE